MITVGFDKYQGSKVGVYDDVADEADFIAAFMLYGLPANEEVLLVMEAAISSL